MCTLAPFPAGRNLEQASISHADCFSPAAPGLRAAGPRDPAETREGCLPSGRRYNGALQRMLSSTIFAAEEARVHLRVGQPLLRNLLRRLNSLLILTGKPYVEGWQ
jgi:hypothetical protein